MKILLLQSSVYIPSLGGANKANRLLLEQLAAQGNECRVIGTPGEDGATAFRHAGVEVEAVDPARLRGHVATRLRELAPDRVLVSSEDPAQVLLEEAVEASPHVVYIAHTTLHLPFGPDGFLQSPARTALLRRTAGIIAVSGYVRDYLRQHAGLGSTLLRFPVYGAGPFPDLGDFDRGFVTLINPCAVKGISIFLELARRLPEVPFAAVPTWGTTAEDREALAALPNVHILPPAANVDEIFAQTRALLAPSLWGEAFGQVVVEAMLRGIPVLASNAGGLPEAKLGVDHVLPVRPIRRYEERFDERKIPVAVIPEQDLGPWEETLRRVLGDRDHYERLSRESRRAAHAFVADLGTAPFEAYLKGLRRMKILLVQPLTYLFGPGGAHKANRFLLQGLAARGHSCRAVAPRDGEEAVFEHQGVEIHTAAGGLELCAEVARQVRAFDPDWTIVSEDPSGELLQKALEASPSRVVYLAHSPATLPFGPASFAADEAKTALLRRTAGILTVSRAMQDYIRRWAGLDSTVVYSPAYGAGPFPASAGFDRGFVTMINPSGIKGVSIFAGLARRMPEVSFAAVPTWSTTDADRGLLAGLPNVEILPAVDDGDELFARVRVLLAPSLWGEAFGQVVIEALLRGIPVIASDQGGLPEAGLGAARIVPVRPIERYEERLDDRRMPVPVVPEQDLAPWETELRSLLSDRGACERLSEDSRRAAARFVAGLGIEPYERFLAALSPAAMKEDASAKPAGADLQRKLAGLSPEKLELLARRLKKKDGAPAPAAETIPSLPRGTEGGDRFPLSFAQRRLWFLDRLEPGSLAYNEFFAIRLDGRIEARLLAEALDRICRRHEVLRTVYTEGEEDEPVQVVVQPRPDDRLPVPVTDLRALPEPARRKEAARLATAGSRLPFDLANGPVLRAALLVLGAEEHLLLITAHHIAVDNWSATVFFAELTALYGGLEPPTLPVQFADFAAWQRGRLTGAVLAEQIGFWRDQLAGAPALLDLPADRPRPARQSFRGTRTAGLFPPRLAEALRGVARRRDATPYMLLLAAFQTLLHRLGGQDDLVVGTPVAGRTRPEVEPLIGCFLNTLPLRARLAPGLRFEELLDQVRRTALDAFAHQDLPFERLVEALAPERSLSHPPVFQVLFNFLNVPPRTEEMPGGARLTAVPVQSGTTRFDLELYMEEHAHGLVVDLVHNTDLFDDATARRLLGHLEILLAGVAEHPEEPVAAMPLLTAAERHQLEREWNDTASEISGSSGVHHLFAAQVRRSPDAPAVAFQGSEITYAELAGRARSLAAHLRALGCGPETRVGVALDRGLDLPVALLAVLESGSAYVPLDPGYPRERLDLMLDDAAPRVVITQESLLAELLPGALDSPVPFHDLQLAYTLYTSGSTGRPKGVDISHRALANFLSSMRRAPGFAPGERLLAVTSPAFDIAALEIFLPLTTGGCVELANREEASDGVLLAARLRASGAGVMQATPATWRMLLDAGWPGEPGLRALCGGEALPESLAAELRERTAEVWNLYGPTETTVWSSIERLSGSGPVSIGRPIANTVIRVGSQGELLIGGAGLARGYLGRPDLTAERFVPDGLSDTPGARLYRTGDLARFRADGRLEHLGRLDHQVKVRGFRIELGEIEAALARHPGIREAVVTLRDGALVAYVVPVGDVPAGLRDFLCKSLPEPMVPAVFVPLAALPLTPNRKVDRKALPSPDPAEAVAAAVFVAPRTPTEEMLAGLWAEVLGRERVGVHDSFFDLGGHSLLATRVLARLRGLFGVELPLRTLFERPTVAGLAAVVEEVRLRGETTAPPLVQVPRTGDLPLSYAQERLWFLDRLDPGSAAYNIPAAFGLTGPFDAPALEAGLNRIVARHEALRTTFPGTGSAPAQVIAPVLRLALPMIDLGGLPEALRETEAHRLAGEEAARPFDLARGPLVRAALLRLGKERHVALFNLHHIVADGGSLEILVAELSERSNLPELPVQYADWAVWQRTWLEGGALARQLDAWRGRMAGAPAALDLQADRRRPAAQTFRGGIEPLAVPADLVRGLRTLGRRRGATLFMTVLAGWAALLHRMSGAPEVVVGSPVANRRQPELEGLIGLFVNTLPLRVDLGGDPVFLELLDRVRATALAAYDDQDVPFERLVEALETGRDLSRSPLFQVLLTLQEGAPASLRLPGVAVEEIPLHGGTVKLDLLLSLTGGDGTLAGGLEYNADLFDAATARRLADRLVRLLAGAAAGPDLRIGDLPLLDAAEERQILTEWNATAAPFPRDLGLHELFEAQAARTPGATAVIHGEQRVSFAELDARAGRLARRLRALGAGPEILVGVFCGRNPDLIAAVLAVLKAGGAYLPLDPAYPPERLSFLLADSGATLVVTEPGVAGGLPPFAGEQVSVTGEPGEAVGGESPSGFLHPEQMAYAIYTSGSTGTPKGVMVRHGSAVARVAWALSAYAPEVLSGVLAATSLCFDLSVFEIFVPLAAGGAVILADNALALPALPAASAVTLVNTVPSAMAELVRSGPLPGAVRVVNLAGEPLRRELAEKIYAQDGIEEVFNLYGPSEDTTYSAGARVRRGDGREPAIGRPLPNSRAYVLDAGLRTVPPGVPGELWLGGEGVARGYLRRPDLTADRFRPDPFGPPGVRLYRTGDLARQRADGTLDYLGRLDRQVKIRGFRIEPGEIEAALLAISGVREAAVEVREMAGSPALVAYVAGDASSGALRETLRDRLPGHMIPAFFVTLPALPLTPNGKLDRAALPAPSARKDPAAPRTQTEELLAGIWAEVLGLERAGLRRSFFELGGHSLLATRVMARLRDVFGVELPLRTLFERPTIETLAVAVEEARRGGAGRAAPPPLVPVPREAPLPLSFAQERLWFIDHLTPGQAAYNIPAALHLAGPLDAGVLALALGTVAGRHEPLRTVFALRESAPVAVIADPFIPAIPVIDLAGLPSGAGSRLTRELAREEAGRPFDLRTGPLLRLALLRLAAEEHVLLLTVHHIASDGWSMGLLVHEATALYAAFAAGRPSPLPTPAVQYGDFAAWQRSWLQGAVMDEEIAFWRRQLAGLPAQLALSTDRPRPAVQRYRGAARPVRLPAGLVRRMEALGRREGATLFMVLLAGFQSLLARYSGQQDLAVGSPVAGRSRVETEGLIGFFVNTLVLRGDLTGDPAFRELLGRTRETALAAYGHQDVPFEKLVQELAPERSLAHTPFFQVALALQNTPTPPLELPGIAVRTLEVETGSAKFDLTLSLHEAGDTLAGSLESNADLFDAPTLDRLLGHLVRLAEAAAADPDLCLSALPLLSSHERQQLLVEGRGWERVSAGTAALHHLFEEQVDRRPDATAVVFQGRSMTYRDLDRDANRLAHLLIRHSVGPEVRVGLCLERSLEMVTAIVAVLKAGGAYVPLDPALPAERLRFQLEDSGVAVLVTWATGLAKVAGWEGPLLCLDENGLDEGGVFDGPDDARPQVSAGGNHLAYVLYTSGSTGRPKGVAVTHANVVRLLEVAREPFGFGPDDTWTLFHSYAFDFSVWEMWGALALGGRLVVVPQDVARSPEDLFRLLRTERVTVLNQTPSAFRQLAPVWNEDSDVRWIIFGGEALEMPSLSSWFERRSMPRLVNMYGITETTVHVTFRPVHAEDAAGARSLIGGPLADLELYTVDRALRALPLGVPGELCVGGEGLARGYWRRPDLTAERFVPDPWSGRPGARLYRSGDLGRRLPDGDVEYLGRIDHQVKIRGLRIELGEIEATLARHPAVRASVVQVIDRPGAPGDRRLAAWVALAPDIPPGTSVTTAELRVFLGDRLADYMVPASFVLMDALPLTPNGKIDRAALPAPEGARPELEVSFVAPRTREERAVAAAWQEVLGVENVGVYDNFFDLGGHSLLMVRVQSLLRQAFSREVPVLDLFQHPTVGALARHLAAAPEETAAPAVLVAGQIQGESRGEGRRSRAAEQQQQRLRRRAGRSGDFEA